MAAACRQADESVCLTGSELARTERVLESNELMVGGEVRAYDQMVRRHAWLLNRPFVNFVARHGPPHARILDIGTGPGWIPIELASRRPNWKLYGVDGSEDMIRCARKNACDEGVNCRVIFQHGQVGSLPFEDGCFDLVISQYVLHHLERPEELLSEAARLVRPGGSVIVKDLFRSGLLWSRTLAAFARYALRYDDAQLRMYRESQAASLTMKELREAVSRSRLPNARVRRCWPYEFLLMTGC